MTERQMATIRRVAEVKDIEGADLIQAYRIDGWWVVGQKDQYKEGNLVIYCEIDSWIPHELAPFLSRGKEPKEYNGIKGERLRTIKLRGQISQGLLLPKDIVESKLGVEVFEGECYDGLLNIIKWELSEKEFIKKYLANPEAREGGFPWFIPKSDQERIQNIKDVQIKSWVDRKLTFEVTEKLEGSSMTVYYVSNKHIQDEGVCSRNINIKLEQENNNFIKAEKQFDILNKIKTSGRNIAIQGELLGPGVQGDYYDLDELDFYCYNIWDIDNQSWLNPYERVELCSNIGVKHVPVLDSEYEPKEYTRDYFLDLADGFSTLCGKLREGLVFKSNNTTDQFKAVSNDYLLESK